MKRIPNVDQRTHDRLRQVAEERADMIRRLNRTNRITGVLIGVTAAMLLALLANLVAGVLQ